MDVRRDETDIQFLEQSDVVIFGTPVYFTSMSWELKQWFDHSFRINLRGKLGAVFVTAQSAMGGIDTAMMEMLRHMLVKGMLVFSGAGDKTGNKFQIGAAGLAKDVEKSAELFEIFGECVAHKATELFGE